MDTRGLKGLLGGHKGRQAAAERGQAADKQEKLPWPPGNGLAVNDLRLGHGDGSQRSSECAEPFAGGDVCISPHSRPIDARAFVIRLSPHALWHVKRQNHKLKPTTRNALGNFDRSSYS